ncbi:MAG: IMP dehydrogenase, partial [Bacteroidales bacterium]|nr:IMP dehydrogenase [Bacteroidales bacterium]
MTLDNNKFLGEALTYDDVLLVPAYSEVMPREVDICSFFSRNIHLNIPIVSAAMDTVTEAMMAIAIAQEGGIGVIHKNMTIEEQANQVRKVKRAENGMILDPVTLTVDAIVRDAFILMKEYGIGGIPVVTRNKELVGIVTHRDLRFELNAERPIADVMTKDNLITT